MSTCRGCLTLRAFRPRYLPSQSLYGYRRFSTARRSRSLPAASTVSHSWNRAHPGNLRQPRNFSSTTRVGAESTGVIHSALPVCCPGCGAYSQTVDPNEPGYYSKTRKETRKRIAETKRLLEEKANEGEETVDLKTEAENAARDIQELTTPSEDEEGTTKPIDEASLEKATTTATNYLVKSTPPVQICDRCHDLRHHNKAVPAASPTLYSIRQLLEESPHKFNHVYHILDAVDFPMSLIRGIYNVLDITEQRSRNRRSKPEKYRGGKRLPDITFVITRADLLAPQPELVDKKMEYMRSVLRDALPRSLRNARLGNVKMISCFRGWRVKQLKEAIRQERGAIWTVGKTNVGKSQFIESCFPKDTRNHEKIAELVERRREDSNPFDQPDIALGSDQLLPPAPREDLYPVLPVVSSLSGTTVSPIRIPFGRGRGEMIDLPGLHRDGLDGYVEDEHKSDLTMTRYIRNPDRQTIKGDQSLLLGGGLVRITPKVDSVLTAACFVPIETHVTKTEKAASIQTQQTPYPGKVIMKEGVGETVSSAGIFDLKWDVTHKNLPRSLAKAVKDQGVPIPDLPYRVFAADLLVEGCGWIELTMQIRAADLSNPDLAPRVEVFTPNGRHVGWREPIQCYTHVQERQLKAKRRTPPRGRQNIALKKRQAGGAKNT